MLPVCYDPYVGTLGRFTRAEIISLVAKAGYDGINVPVNAAFLGDVAASDVDDLVARLEDNGLVAPTVGYGRYELLTNPDRADDVMPHFEVALGSLSASARRSSAYGRRRRSRCPTRKGSTRSRRI